MIGIAREVALEEPFVCCYVLDGDDTLAGLHLDDPIDQEERVAVRDDALDVVNDEHDDTSRGRLSAAADDRSTACLVVRCFGSAARSGESIRAPDSTCRTRAAS